MVIMSQVKIVAKAQLLWCMLGILIQIKWEFIHPNIYFSLSFVTTSASWDEQRNIGHKCEIQCPRIKDSIGQIV